MKRRAFLSFFLTLPLAAQTKKPDPQGPWDVPANPSLPNVLLIGDSISIGYTRAVRRMLAGEANVMRPLNERRDGPSNCGPTPRGLELIDDWLGGTKWDVIHFNWGLHDLCYRNPTAENQGNRDKVNGKQAVPAAIYKQNLEQLVKRLEATGSKLVWASTTVVPEGEAGRFVGDDEKYNAVAAEVMQAHGIPTDDLYAVSKSFPEDLFVGPGNVHFTLKGYERLAESVARSVREALARR
ncbi:MAG: SGNH/GDSL hydrolase family protein [Bryobacterales bacterium]